ncbi:MAG: Na+/H+ antiporter subunit E [Solirubrobacteraceae bacterium]
MSDDSGSDRRRRRAPLPAVLLLWVGLLAAWFLLVDTSSIAELLAGAASAAVAAALTVLAREEGLFEPALWIGIGFLARALIRVPADLALLARQLLRALAGRQSRGRLHEIELELPDSSRGDARRAAIELIGSIAPNTIVLGVDDRHVVVHQLVARRAERERLRLAQP